MKRSKHQWSVANHGQRTTNNGQHRANAEFQNGFTLLEVTLALAILAGAVATLGELVRSGLANAQTARDLTRAEMLCEGIEEQVVAGAIAPSSASSVPCDDDPRWLYSISSESDQTGLLTLQITVTKDVPAGQHPVQFSLWRWMIDPGVAPESNDNSQSTSSSSSGTTSGSSTGGQ
ncbi:MAG TPA: prepilin-type N-terminal cleavage/methylation domain-containing protein [Pirellulales bacterium]|nr:prepilin-type N-terminal cleavage/methylation domain-containing protein [Pirellulales bacterium]